MHQNTSMSAFGKKKNLRLPLSQPHTQVSVLVRRRIFLGVGIIILFLATLILFKEEVKNSFYALTIPVSRTIWTAGNGTSTFLGSLSNVANLQTENSSLRQENEKLLSDLVAAQESLRQTQSITQAIENTKDNHFAMVVAGVVGFDTGSDFIVIDKGSDQGISENMPVISDNKVVFGRVFKVYKGFSKVMLVSNTESTIDAKIQNSDLTSQPVLGVIKGLGNLSVYLDLIPSDQELLKDQVLLTSGQEGIFPKDLLIGKITSKNQSDAKPFQTAKIQPFFNIKTVDSVFVITNYKREN